MKIIFPWCLLLISLVVGLCLGGDEDGALHYLSNAKLYITKATDLFHTCKKRAECKEQPGKILDCADLQRTSSVKSGVYTIWPTNRLTMNKGVNVYCDMDTDGGGWTVIQRRGRYGKPSNYFYRDWESFKSGFGNVSEDFWLGNDNIFALTNQKAYSVRFDMRDQSGRKAYAHYSKFWIDDELNQYALHIAGYKGNAGEAMSVHDKSKFSTKDRDNDKKPDGSCAVKFQSGWWFEHCYFANLNGMYYNNTYGIKWLPLGKNVYLPWTEIKIRPNNDIPERKWHFERPTRKSRFG